MSKRIKLSKGRYAIVDDEDYEWLSKHKWNCGALRYAVRTLPRLKDKKMVYMHREVNKTPEGMDTDHINGDTLDNRKVNLRTCTRSENMMNSGLRSDNSSGFKGVSWNKRAKKWVAYIRSSPGNRVYLGLHDDVDDAVRAYNEAVIKYHGEFAYQNEIHGASAVFDG